MILVISGTNRNNSNTKIIAKHIFHKIKHLDEEVEFLALDEMDWSNIIETMYDSSQHPTSLRDIDEKLMIPSSKWIIVSPEYNGSIPGILKLFIDAISTHRYADTFAGKEALLIGVPNGRAGNLRGMEHLTGFLNYLKIHVFPQKLPISSVSSVIDENKQVNEATDKAITDLLDAFMFKKA